MDIQRKREKVYELWDEESSNDLVDLYDQYFFGGLIEKYGSFDSFDGISDDVHLTEWNLMEYLFEVYIPTLQKNHPDLKIPSYRRKIMLCMYWKVFGWGLDVVASLYSNWSSSCYLDSVAVAILFAKGPFNRCVLDFEMTSDPKYITFAKQVRSILREDYLSLTSPLEERMKCKNLRSIIRKIVPHPLEQFPAPNTYDAFCDMFPTLKIIIPHIQFRNTVANSYVRPKVPAKVKMCLVPVWEFMDGDILRSREGRVLLWESFQGDHIVFQNTFAPPIEHLSSLESETIEYEDGSEITHKKLRAFGKTILNDTFELTAVVFHKGHKPGLETDYGGHYVLYFKSNDVWYYYDDLEGGVIHQTTLSEKVFISGERSRPELLFYIRKNAGRVTLPDYRLLVDEFVGKRDKVVLDYSRKDLIRVVVNDTEPRLLTRESVEEVLKKLKKRN